MYAVSSLWDGAIRNSGRRITRVDIYNRWDDINTEMYLPGELLIEDALCESVSVTVDRNAQHRRTATMTVVDEAFKTIVEAFSPNLFGLEFDIYMGVDYGDGTEELVPMGVFCINQLDYTDRDTGVQLGLVDRSVRLTYYKAEAVYTIASTRNLTLVAHDFLDNPEYANFSDISLVVQSPMSLPAYSPASYSVSDPLTFLRELVLANTNDPSYEPADIFFSQTGQLWVKRIPELLSSATVNDAVWVFSPGEQGDLMGVDISLQLTGFINNVLVGMVLDESDGVSKGEFAWITGGYTDPNGPAGWRSKRYDAEPADIPNLAELALARLGDTWGIERRVTANGLGNPALDAGDIIGVELHDGSVVLQIIESLTIDSSFQMQIQTRGQRL